MFDQQLTGVLLRLTMFSQLLTGHAAVVDQVELLLTGHVAGQLQEMFQSLRHQVGSWRLATGGVYPCRLLLTSNQSDFDQDLAEGLPACHQVLPGFDWSLTGR